MAATPVDSLPSQTVTVTGYSSEGDGVARLGDGRVVFIRNAARGDVIEAVLTDVRHRSARADIVRIIAPSPYRIEPGCPVYPECGGCDFRHITYEEELDAKLRRLNDALERIGGLPVKADSILRTGQIEGYRNKAVFHSDGQSLGFYKSRSHEVIRIGRCPLLKDELNEALRSLTPGGDITLRSGRNGVDVSTDTRTPGGDTTLRSGRNGVSVSTDSRTAGGDITLRSGRNGPVLQLEEELDGLVFRISGFFQVNTGAALLLYQKAREYAALTKEDTLIDLYCGVGTLTLFAGRDAGFALGVELDSSAVKAARENARLNNLPHIQFIKADAADWDADIVAPDCIIADPPRRGLTPGVVRKIIELSPKRIVYISCDPATLARDLRALDGYCVKDICAVDMFPRTANVECCCLLAKAGS